MSGGGGGGGEGVRAWSHFTSVSKEVFMGGWLDGCYCPTNNAKTHTNNVNNMHFEARIDQN